ncbi:hypothetical protein B0A54_17806 [Friedmanniomyces endolithicus]|uniref:Uncharacterized protein n=1 Tax=Friedmanniomyces endolithicus TaxID=329885 RepID=A0A4U0TQ45_9PEZI|nr:hypothetical protein B0A54_17806 [Friedmanniomyces endolithicus]
MAERWKLWRAVLGWKKEMLLGNSTVHASTAALADTSCSIVTIPSAELLSEKERADVYDLARELQYQSALVAHLDAMTPPVDSQETFEEQREHEMKAREELRADGCPPCYPADVDISMEDVPEVHKDGVEYFRISTSWVQIFCGIDLLAMKGYYAGLRSNDS